MKNLHDEGIVADLGIESCLQDATIMSAAANGGPEDDSNDLTVGNFRLHKGVKAEAHRICQSKGTTLSTFLRTCCERLVATRQGPQDPEALVIPPAAIIEQLKPQED